MTDPKPIDPAATTLVLPENELAARRKADPDEPTAVLRRPTVRELEQRLLELERRLLVDDEAPTQVQPVLEDPAK
jgi:hypothetical protein